MDETQVRPEFLQFLTGVTVKPPEMSTMERVGLYGSTLLPRVANNLASSIGNITGTGGGGFLPPEDLAAPEASTTAGQVTNFIGGGLAPAAIELAMVGGVIPKIAGASRAVQVGNAAIRNAAEFGVLGAQEDAGTGTEQAGEGAALGLAKALSLRYRIPFSLALGAASKMYFDDKHPNSQQGNISGALQTAMGIFGGQAKAPVPRPLAIPTEFGGEFGAPNAPAIDSSEIVPTPQSVPQAPGVTPLPPPSVLAQQEASRIAGAQFSGNPLNANRGSAVPMTSDLNFNQPSVFRPEVAPTTLAPSPQYIPPAPTPLSPETLQSLFGRLDTNEPKPPIEYSSQPLQGFSTPKIWERTPEVATPAIAEETKAPALQSLQSKASVASETDELSRLTDLLKPKVETVTPSPIKAEVLPETPVQSEIPPSVHASGVKEPPLVKMARSTSITTQDLIKELGYYSDAEIATVAKNLRVSPNNKVIAETLKEKYALKGSGEGIGPWGSDIRPGERTDHIDDLAAGEQTPSFGMKRKMSPGEYGAVVPELSQALARTLVGGIGGGVIGSLTDDNNDHSGFVYGAMVGAAGASLGPEVARAATKSLAEAKLSRQALKGGLEGSRQAEAIKPKAGDFAKTFGAKMEEKFGAAFNGPQTAGARLARYLDRGLKLTQGAEVGDALSQAKGVGSYIVGQVDDALAKVAMRFKPIEEVKNLANDFLDGKTDSKQFLQSMQMHITNDPENKNFAQYMIAAGEGRTALQRILKDGIADKSQAKMIEESFNKYVTRSYKLFTDEKWNPPEDTVNKLASQVFDGKFFGKDFSYDQVQSQLRQYIRERKFTKGVMQPASAEGEKISQQAFKSRKDLSNEWREFLGEIKDPAERIQDTIFRLRPMAEASQFFANINNVNVRGLPQVFESAEKHKAFLDSTLQALQKNGADVDAQWRAAALQSYQYVEKIPSYGSLGGKWVSRNVWDNLKTFDTMSEPMSPWMRSMAKLNTGIKLSRTVANPLTMIRNYVTAPAFAAIARVDWTDIPESVRIFTNNSHPLQKEIVEMGIANADSIKGEIYRDFHSATGGRFNFGSIDMAKFGMGKLDLDLATKYGQKGFQQLGEIYRAPDAIVRVASYISAKRRIAQQLGLELDSPIVKQKAAEFTNRYTMNYENIAPLIKGVRQVPFVNLFLSYSAEVARISKNLMFDVIEGQSGNVARHDRMYAMMPLAALAVVPDMLQKASEASLSPQDKKDWERAKSLMPEYSRTRYRFDIKRDPKTKQFTYLDFTPIVPADAYNQMSRAILNGDMEALAAVNPLAGTQNTPLLNIIVSQTTGKDLQTKREFRNGSDRFASVAKELLPPLTPNIGSEAMNLRNALTFNENGERGLTNTKTGNRITPSDFWATYFGPLADGNLLHIPGIKSSGVNLGVLEKKIEAQAKQDVANEIAYANDVIKSDAAPEVKRRQIDKTKAALQAIRERYASQLGLSSSPTSSTNNVPSSQRQ